MDRKLEEYRKLKRRTALVNNATSLVKKCLSWSQSDSTITTRLQETKELIGKKDEDEEDNVEPETEEVGEEVEEESEPKSLLLKRLIYVLYFVLWATLYFIAVKIEFGAIYFIVSGLFFVYFNTRTKPKRPGEISAYSVFNPNCEAIDGTLNAEQFERQIRFGGLI